MDPLRPLKIVFVEDDPSLCDGWVDLLSLDGHQVRTYHHAGDFLADGAAWQSGEVVVSDYYLPDMNGLQLLQEVRRRRSDVPLVLLTGIRDPEIKAAVERLRRAEFLTKPIRIEALERCIRKLLEGAVNDGARHGRA